MLAGELLIPETEVASFIRQARSIPDYAQSEAILGLLFISWGKIQTGTEHCERSIEADPFAPAAWITYSQAMMGRRMYSADIDIIYRGIKYESPPVIKMALNKALMWADIPMIKRLLQIMSKLKIETPDEIAARAMLQAAKEAEDDGIDEIASCAMTIAEREGLPLFQTQLVHDFDGNLVFCYRLQDPSSRELSRLNGLLIDLIIERGLEAKNSIAVFERA